MNRSGFGQLAACLILAASALPLSGCGAYIVGSTVVGAGKLAVKGTVGAVKLTGHAAGTLVGLAQGEDEETEAVE